MFTNVDFSGFIDAFRNMNREEQFSYEAKRALFDYFEELEESTGESIELDVIAICCDFTEYALKELVDSYGDEYDDLDDAERALSAKTSIVGRGKYDDGTETIVIQSY